MFGRYSLCLVGLVIVVRASAEHVVSAKQWADADEYLAHALPATVEDAFTTGPTMSPGISPISVAIHPLTRSLVSINGEALLVVPIAYDVTQHTLRVKSYVIRLNKKNVLFYPIVSIVGSDFSIQETVYPKYEFVFNDNILVNEFLIPEGTTRLIIHSSRKYFEGSFVGDLSIKKSSFSEALKLGTNAFGGPLLALILHGSGRGAAEEREFRFGKVGAIDVAYISESVISK